MHCVGVWVHFKDQSLPAKINRVLRHTEMMDSLNVAPFQKVLIRSQKGVSPQRIGSTLQGKLSQSEPKSFNSISDILSKCRETMRLAEYQDRDN